MTTQNVSQVPEITDQSDSTFAEGTQMEYVSLPKFLLIPRNDGSRNPEDAFIMNNSNLCGTLGDFDPIIESESLPIHHLNAKSMSIREGNIWDTSDESHHCLNNKFATETKNSLQSNRHILWKQSYPKHHHITSPTLPNEQRTMPIAASRVFTPNVCLVKSCPLHPEASQSPSLDTVPPGVIQFRCHGKGRFGSSLRWRRFRKLFSLILIVSTLTYLGYRLQDWYSRYKLRKSLYLLSAGQTSNMERIHQINMNLEKELNVHRTGKSYDDSKGPILKLCNINPIRGTSLFMFGNGSHVYDVISSYMNYSINKLENGAISTDQATHAGHRIDEMLKLCWSASKSHQPQDFAPLMTKRGLCHILQLEVDTHEMKFLLDPQEYDYIIPHRGPIGFRISLHPNAEAATMADKLDPGHNHILINALISPYQGVYTNEAVVTPDFHASLRFGLTSMVSSIKHPIKVNDLSATSSGELFPVNTTGNVAHALLPSTEIRLISSLQTIKSPTMGILLSFTRPHLFERNQWNVVLGLQIQQRAYLRLVNLTAHNQVEQLVTDFLTLRLTVDRTMQRLHMLGENLQGDRRILNQRQIYGNSCTDGLSDHFNDLVNITTTFEKSMCIMDSLKLLPHASQRECDEKRNFYAADTLSSSSSLDETAQLDRTKTKLNERKPYSNQESFKLEADHPRLVELQVVDLLFTTDWSNSGIRDMLRGLLRKFSAHSMKLRSKYERRFHEPTYDGSCESGSGNLLIAKYVKLETELGEMLAESIHRLESFTGAMGHIAQSNIQLLREFRLSAQANNQITTKSLVSFDVQVEKSVYHISHPQLSPLSSVFGPMNELANICFTTLGTLLLLLLLTDYLVNRWMIIR